MAKDLLFFIALLPDEEIRREYTPYKNDCARKFGTSHALKSPPHITLVPPFRWREEQLEALKDTLDLFALGQEPFEVQLRHFNCFKPRVIY
ncbi:MAG: 2'-5' RNA ligase family protein, partial [Saprospiraceae bacterium]